MRLATPNTATARHAHHYGRRELTAAAVADAGKLAHDLVVSRIHVIRELDLRDRAQPVHRHADGSRHDTAFRDGRIEHAMLAETLLQAFRATENSTEVADVLAHHH